MRYEGFTEPMEALIAILKELREIKELLKGQQEKPEPAPIKQRRNRRAD